LKNVPNMGFFSARERVKLPYFLLQIFPIMQTFLLTLLMHHKLNSRTLLYDTNSQNQSSQQIHKPTPLLTYTLSTQLNYQEFYTQAHHSTSIYYSPPWQNHTSSLSPQDLYMLTREKSHFPRSTTKTEAEKHISSGKTSPTIITNTQFMLIYSLGDNLTITHRKSIKHSCNISLPSQNTNTKTFSVSTFATVADTRRWKKWKSKKI
jgi:hypothetical protein